jgi:hypothetical protein
VSMNKCVKLRRRVTTISEGNLRLDGAEVGKDVGADVEFDGGAAVASNDRASDGNKKNCVIRDHVRVG